MSKQILSSELPAGQHPGGPLKKCFCESFTKTLPVYFMRSNNWGKVAEDRQNWRHAAAAHHIQHQQDEGKGTRIRKRAQRRLRGQEPSPQLRCRFCER